VRTVPRSRRHPHFERDALAAVLSGHGIGYRHFAGLGGLRKPRVDSPNGGWRHEGFRGYADHMQSPEFAAALDALLAWAEARSAALGNIAVMCAEAKYIAVMCAEAKWWQCHRQLIADAVVARGFEVRHIMSIREAPRHALTPFARVEGTAVTYPALV